MSTSEQLYHIRSDRHFGTRTTLTLDNQPYNLYTDPQGYLRQIKDNLGDPNLPQKFADFYAAMPPRLGWTITPVAPETEELDYDILHVLEDGVTVEVIANNPVTAKLKALTLENKQYEAIVATLQQELDAAKAETVELKTKLDTPPPAVKEENTLPPAPMIDEKSGKLTKAGRPKGNRGNGNDTLVVEPEGDEGTPVAAAIDDIPRT